MSSGWIEKYKTPRGCIRHRARLQVVSRSGHVTRSSKSFDSKAAARAWLAQQQHFSAQGGMLAKGTAGRYLKDWQDMRAAMKAIRPNTLAGYRSKLASAISYFGQIQLSQLSAEDVEEWLTHLSTAGGIAQRPLRPSSIKQCRDILHKALADAVRKRLIPFNPVDGTSPFPVPDRGRPRVDRSEDLRRFLIEMDATEDGPMYRLMGVTGMRRSEVGGLAWRSVDLVAAYIDIDRTLIRDPGCNGWTYSGPKSKSSKRRIYISAGTVHLLHRQLIRVKEWRLAAGSSWTEEDLVFCTPYGQRLNLDTVGARARRVRLRLGLPKDVMPTHGLRHNYGTRQVKSGTDVATVRDSMGHSRSSTTLDLYVGTDEEAARKAADVMEDFLD